MCSSKRFLLGCKQKLSVERILVTFSLEDCPVEDKNKDGLLMCYDFLIDINIVHTSKNDKCPYNRIFNTLKAASRNGTFNNYR